MNPSMLPVALRCLEYGWFIFPLNEKAKTPDGGLAPNGYLNSSNDIQIVTDWWMKKPNNNVGIDLGKSNLTVLDFDNGEPPSDLTLPDTFRVKTGRGYHVYLTGARKKSDMYWKGVKIGQIMSTGGYVLSPKSVHPSGAIYTVTVSKSIAPSCNELIDGLSVKNSDVRLPIDMQAKILDGNRDIELTRRAGKLRHDGLNVDEIYTVLSRINQECCEPPKADEDIHRISRSIGSRPLPQDSTVLINGKPVNSSVTTSEVEVKVVEESNTVYLDMSEDCIGHGVLADVCRTYMGHFPRSYAFPALLTVAGNMIRLPEQTADESIAISAGCGNLTNLYTCLTGEVGSGKTQAIQHAIGHLNLNPRNYTDTKAGSIEGLLRKIAKKMGPSIGVRNQIMVDLDEWSHLFKKAGIDNAAFVDILNSGFNKPEFHLTIAGGEQIDLVCALSLIGGMPTDKVEECFGSSSVGGFHDRFLFGVCPTINPFEYQPFDVAGAAYNDPFLDLNPSGVTIHKDVWRLAAEWKKADPTLGRSVEVTIRCGTIIAAFDHKLAFSAEDLQGMRPFLDYQVNARKLITPNAGATNDAKMTNSILAWLNAHAGNGEWTTQRSLKKGIKSQLALLGPMAYNNSIRNLTFINAIELNVKLNPGTRPSEIIRLIKGS